MQHSLGEEDNRMNFVHRWWAARPGLQETLWTGFATLIIVHGLLGWPTPAVPIVWAATQATAMALLAIAPDVAERITIRRAAGRAGPADQAEHDATRAPRDRGGDGGH